MNSKQNCWSVIPREAFLGYFSISCKTNIDDFKMLQLCWFSSKLKNLKSIFQLKYSRSQPHIQWIYFIKLFCQQICPTYMEWPSSRHRSFTTLRYTGKLGIFLLALLLMGVLLLDFGNFSDWHYYLGRHFFSGQESTSTTI